MVFRPSRIIAGVMNWGAWGAQLSKQDTATLIQECVDMGVTSFDHADIYGDHTTEADWGAAYKTTGIKRTDIELITKCGIMMPSPQRPQIEHKHYDTSRAHIVKSVENSLRNLHTDYIDLLLIHRPSPLLEADVLADVFADLQQSGKVLHFGVSNFTPSQVSLVLDKTPLIANQIEISPTAIDCFVDGSLDLCMSEDILPMAWSPLSGGRLFGSELTASDIALKQRLTAVAAKYDWDLDYMIYLFLLHHPAHIHVVTGSSKIRRIEVAHEASHAIISDAQWFEIYTACLSREVA